MIYIVYGEKYIAEALASAASLKRAMPELPVTFFCDGAVESPIVDQVVRIARDPEFPDAASRIPHFRRSPYDETLFLDCDTYVTDDLSELFDLLATFDVALAHSTSRVVYTVDVPDSFPELNCGVILFRRAPETDALFAAWATTFGDHLDRLRRDAIAWRRTPDKRFDLLNDQCSFREAIFRSPVRLATLPPEYNCRFADPGFLEGKVKILHGRGIDLPQAASAINARLGRRGFEQRSGRIRLGHFYEPSTNPYRVESIRYMLRRQGFLWTAKAALQRLLKVIVTPRRARDDRPGAA